jgi:hypothetical protein
VQINQSGQLFATASATNPVLFNRRTSDGAIATFRKDGTTVGTIGVNASDLFQVSSSSSGGFFVADNGTNKFGFVNGEEALRPASDSTLDLGKTDRRFQNLYLSGGVYLGGTGAANKLDDYETGTFTPTIGGSTGNPTATYTVNNGEYTKIGDLVYVAMDIELSALSGGSGFVELDGLPFTAQGVSNATGVLSITRTGNFASNLTTGYLTAMVASGDTRCLIYYNSDLSTAADILNITDLTSTTNFRVSGCYQAA